MPLFARPLSHAVGWLFPKYPINIFVLYLSGGAENCMTRMMRLEEKLRTCITVKQRESIRRYLGLNFRRLQHCCSSVFLGSNLQGLAIFYGTDKWGDHWYIKNYETHFRSIRNKKLNVLEIGIGGGEDPELGGNSLRMWKVYFPKAKIYGIDIFDKRLHAEHRIKTYQGSQGDNKFLEEVTTDIGEMDIVIDDGSHQNEHVISTFNYLFPKLSRNGIYVIEDTQTSYWKKYGGSSVDVLRKDTTIGFLKERIDGLDYEEFEIPEYQPNKFDKEIISMHFYHNIVFIQKGVNVDS
jgi:hypothetical protein